MHAVVAILLGLAVWFIALIITGFSGVTLLCGPLVVSGVTLAACMLPARRRTYSEGLLGSSLER